MISGLFNKFHTRFSDLKYRQLPGGKARLRQDLLSKADNWFDIFSFTHLWKDYGDLLEPQDWLAVETTGYHEGKSLWWAVILNAYHTEDFTLFNRLKQQLPEDAEGHSLVTAAVLVARPKGVRDVVSDKISNGESILWYLGKADAHQQPLRDYADHVFEHYKSQFKAADLTRLKCYPKPYELNGVTVISLLEKLLLTQRRLWILDRNLVPDLSLDDFRVPLYGTAHNLITEIFRHSIDEPGFTLLNAFWQRFKKEFTMRDLPAHFWVEDPGFLRTLISKEPLNETEQARLNLDLTILKTVPGFCVKLYNQILAELSYSIADFHAQGFSDAQLERYKNLLFMLQHKLDFFYFIGKATKKTIEAICEPVVKDIVEQAELKARVAFDSGYQDVYYYLGNFYAESLQWENALRSWSYVPKEAYCYERALAAIDEYLEDQYALANNAILQEAETVDERKAALRDLIDCALCYLKDEAQQEMIERCCGLYLQDWITHDELVFFNTQLTQKGVTVAQVFAMFDGIKSGEIKTNTVLTFSPDAQSFAECTPPPSPQKLTLPPRGPCRKGRLFV